MTYSTDRLARHKARNSGTALFQHPATSRGFFLRVTPAFGILPLGTLAVVVLAGCYQSHVCGAPESCDYRDNDCDSRIDEDFVDDRGVYFTAAHCGECGVACAAQFPTAEQTACEEHDSEMECILVSCPADWHLAGDGACAPDVPALCLTCSENDDCGLREPGARCELMPTGEGRCLTPCDGGCPSGFECFGGLCRPESGLCGCTEDTRGVEFGCLIERDEAYRCAGVQVCNEDGLGVCEPALEEFCNSQDDDCDGAIDEAFRDDTGRYVDRLHCGACAMPCVEPGPNMVATCEPRDPLPAVECVVECEEGFVDVDGIAVNGCECERFDGDGPPPSVGGDADCDGVPDETDDFVYVATTGSDTNPGTLERPMRTVSAALSRAAAQNKDVLVARGVYNGAFDLVAGVSIFGGYRPDFRDRDLSLFPVMLEHTAAPGLPVVRCQGIEVPTRIEGFTIGASDATQPGAGSTAVLMRGCSSAVALADITILAGRGADGVRGRSSSDNYTAAGGASLTDLDGTDGANGNPGTLAGACGRVPAGSGGGHTCRLSGRDVSGGRGGDADCPDLRCSNGGACGNAGCTDFTVGGVCDFNAVLQVAVPNPPPTSGRGVTPGSAGELTYNAPTNRRVCNFCDDNPTLQRNGGRGQDGSAGVDGIGGEGCSAQVVLDEVSGLLHGGDGVDGQPGADGSGGGGGSSGSGYAVIGGTDPGCDDRSGGSGGGGGSGGCGAPQGSGGSGGGASVGLLIDLGGVLLGPSLANVRVVTASGGTGGAGGNGAAGGAPGSGGNGGMTRFWCSRTGGRGGDGGRGGVGGGGGGGCGGGAYGIYLTQATTDEYLATLMDGVDVEQVGVGGRGGMGGFAPGASGTSGVDGETQAFTIAPN